MIEEERFEARPACDRAPDRGFGLKLTLVTGWLTTLACLGAQAQVLQDARLISTTQQVRVYISGRVQLSAGVLLPGVDVEVEGALGRYHTTTDSDGHFRVQVLPGRYTVKASLEGLAVVTVEVNAFVGAAAEVVLTIDPPEVVPSPVSPSPAEEIILTGAEESSDTEVTGEATPFFWNSWIESNRPWKRFEPLVSLSPAHSFDLILDLSTIDYSVIAGTVSSRLASKSVSDLLEGTGNETVDLRIVAIPDALVRISSSERVQEMSVDLARLRNRSSSTGPRVEDPLEELRENPDRDFRAGTAKFRFSTTNEEGTGSLALSIWADGRPVDELSVSYCIARASADCQGRIAFAAANLSGTDSLGADPTAKPDLALHVLDQEDGKAVGVLYCRECAWPGGEFTSWDMSTTADYLEQELGETVLPAIQTSLRLKDAAVRASELRNRGRSLLTLLFGNPRDPSARQAELKFNRAVHRLREAGANLALAKRPSLFVRILPRGEGGALLEYPLGLSYVSQLEGNSGFYLGESLRIESSLPRQDYSRGDECISKWAVFAPKAEWFSASGDPLRMAVEPISQFLARVADIARDSEGKDASSFSMPLDFEEWLSVDAPDPEEPTVILTVSHHDGNQLYYTRLEGLVVASDIRRAFQSPSIAILVGCGTGSAGASEFVRRFNLMGIGAVVATSTEVNGQLAGAFIARMLELLAAHVDEPTYGIGMARWETSLDLFPSFGPEVFSFFVAGNGRLRPCAPQ